jgi:hypothetical protein
MSLAMVAGTQLTSYEAIFLAVMSVKLQKWLARTPDTPWFLPALIFRKKLVANLPVCFHIRLLLISESRKKKVVIFHASS